MERARKLGSYWPLGRVGDPARDIDSGLRAQVADRLAKARAPATWIDMVVRPSDLAEGDLRRVLGDALPAGLRLGGG